MGTDIHPRVEVRRNGIWRAHRPTALCKWYAETWSDQADHAAYISRGGTDPFGSRKYPWDRCKYRLPEAFDSRNYLKFAVLAGVRNGYGFAGTPTHTPLVPIQENRGIPADISAENAHYFSPEEIDHTPGWVSLRDLEEYNFDITLDETGVISEAQFLDCVINHKDPESWSGGISGKDIEVLDPQAYLALFGTTDQFHQIVKPRTYDATKRYWIQYTWPFRLGDALPDIAEMIVYMRGIMPKGGCTDDVRVVFYFDS